MSVTASLEDSVKAVEVSLEVLLNSSAGSSVVICVEAEVEISASVVELFSTLFVELSPIGGVDGSSVEELCVVSVDIFVSSGFKSIMDTVVTVMRAALAAKAIIIK